MTSPSRPRRAPQIPPKLRRLPSLRAAVGAALVFVAGTGVLAAHTAATHSPTTRFTVARADLPLGHLLRAGDLGTVALALPTGTHAISAARAQSLVGRRTATPLRRLDLVRPSDLAARNGAVSGVLVPLDVDASHLPAARLRSGTIVSILATDPDAQGSVTVVPDAVVESHDGGNSDLGNSGRQRVRVRVRDSEAASVLVDAAVRSTITLTLPAPQTAGQP